MRSTWSIKNIITFCRLRQESRSKFLEIFKCRYGRKTLEKFQTYAKNGICNLKWVNAYVLVSSEK